MLLLDTNCWMQLARRRADADDVRSLISLVPRTRLFVSDFSVHSIGVIFERKGMIEGYVDFVDRSSFGRELRIVDVPLAQLQRIADVCLAHRLDFDDAYKYVAAELHGLKLVSFDADFDRTPNGRLTPAAALQLFKEETKA